MDLHCTEAGSFNETRVHQSQLNQLASLSKGFPVSRSLVLGLLLTLVQQVFYSLGHLPALKPLFLNTKEKMITAFLELPITGCCVKQVSFSSRTSSALWYYNDSKGS